MVRLGSRGFSHVSVSGLTWESWAWAGPERDGRSFRTGDFPAQLGIAGLAVMWAVGPCFLFEVLVVEVVKRTHWRMVVFSRPSVLSVKEMF